jgi:hypothetical protein
VVQSRLLIVLVLVVCDISDVLCESRYMLKLDRESVSFGVGVVFV